MARANPVAKLGAAAILMAGLFLSHGPLAPALVLAVLLASVPFTGLSPRDLLARTWPLLLAALAVAVLNVLLAPGTREGPDVVHGLSLGLRLLGIALSGVLAIASTDPTDLADALQQQTRLSPRLAIGVLAAVRMLPMLAVEWQILGMARRARGVSGGRSPVAAVRLAFGMLLALLVGAVRRATRLATAMEARGFGIAPCRTIARPQQMRPADWWLLAGAVVLGALAGVIGLVG
ncbi:MAG: energy-coupling factor transporter transmembrane protein EcfT [Chloroflexota bacterium]|nr:energy-coupling factor transporter transmembrane protein EcfT [Chloroflexota bacterium]